MRRSDFPEIARISLKLYAKYTEPDFPVSYTSAFQALDRLLNYATYLRVMTENGEIVGWMAASAGSHQMHSAIKGIMQTYYHTQLRGPEAVKALIAFHDDFHKFAEKNNFEIAITSSYLPSKERFEQILTENGWNKSGSRLVKRTRHYPHQTQERAKASLNECRPDLQSLPRVPEPRIAPQRTTSEELFGNLANPLN
jgi:hypothetical protein